MKKHITLQNRKVSYTLRKSKRARRMRLAVYCDGSVVVTTPFDLKENVAERFIREKTEWLFYKIAYFKQFQGKPIARFSREDYLKYKDKALEMAVERVNYFNKIYKYDFNTINIKNQKTRWGSCSKKGNLNFNYKLLFLPEKVRDYIIVHELCHLREFNHSRKFWNLVDRTFSDHREIKAELRKHSMNLQ
ncbi:MAG: metal-dependent hydrolase [Parcubacteria group bacterium CG11_big_fil_rev_8_21_14_0_20_41_14]|nr:MAG: metal-dependent hydrolase [Parcubacteria group bacterium CG11_big_fil_rev_8_21_14_0_20_41_14]